MVSSGAGSNFCLAPPLFWLYTSTISRFAERFRDGLHSLVTLLFAVLLLMVPPPFVKVGTCTPVPYGVGATDRQTATAEMTSNAASCVMLSFKTSGVVNGCHCLPRYASTRLWFSQYLMYVSETWSVLAADRTLVVIHFKCWCLSGAADPAAGTSP